MKAGMVFHFMMFLATEVSCQGFAGCRESYFLSNGECLPCPDHCVTCTSNTNCTKCTDNYYGVTCQQTCRQRDCMCHKTYGYCTYGCPDGHFPETDSAQCSRCPANCDLCSSSSTCVLCKPHFYGDTCAQHCATYCETCNKITGKCIVCEEGYHNQDGQCLRCPEGCVGCYDNRKCSACKSGYLELGDGQCIKHCDMNTGDTLSRLNGQRESNEVACSCEESLIGHDMVVKIRQPCIRYMSCPSTVPCLTCGAMMIYQCTHTCRLENETTYRSKSECTVIEGTTHSLTFCLTFEHIASTTECVPVAEDLTHDDTGNGPLFVVDGLVIVFMALVMAIMAVVVIIKWKWKDLKKCFSKLNPPETTDQKIEKDSHTSLCEVECNSSEGNANGCSGDVEANTLISPDPPTMDDGSNLNASSSPEEHVANLIKECT